MRTLFRLIGILLSLTLVLSVVASAHSSSQAGILDDEYIPEYGRYGIGGEQIGWSIDEACHIGTGAFQYRFINVSSALKEKVRQAASLWSEVAAISESSTAIGEFSSYDDPEDGAAATFAPISRNVATGHLTQWLIGMNLAYSITTEDIAHEFGHVIGLNDLYDDINDDKLMYYHVSSTATMPTESDVWGARVILGIHTEHTFSAYRYWGRDENGNHCHVAYCTGCGGVSATHSVCVYLPFETHPVCPLCHTPRDAI